MFHRRAPWWTRAQGRLLSSAPQKIRRRPLPTLPQTRFSRSRWLESSLHTIDPLRDFSSSLELSSAGVAPLSPRSRKILDETVKTFAVFPRGCTFSMAKTIACCPFHLVRVTLTFSYWQSGENCQVAAGAFTFAWLHFLVFFKWRLPFFFACLVVLPTRCLLDVYRLLGLTLRPSAPVCRCHRDSRTRGRLALAQEAVRGPPSLSPCLVLHQRTHAR